MITIKGEHISVIRPAKIKLSRPDHTVWKKPRAPRARTRQIGIAEFFALCLFTPIPEGGKRWKE